MTRALLFLFSFVVLSGCTSVLYHPTRYEHVDRTKMPLKPRDIDFSSEDGTRLHGWYFEASPEGRRNCTLLFFHGNAQNLSSHFYFLYTAPLHGYDYFIFDYRGYGRSEDKKPTPETTAADGRAAIRWLQARDPKRPILVFSQSLGSAIALRAVLDTKDQIAPKAVVVDSGFSSYKAVGRSVLSRSWLTWLFQPLAYVLLSDKAAPERDLGRLPPIPLLVIHGTRDRTVGYENGERLFRAASEPKEFWKIEGGGHTDFMWRENGKYAKQLFEYLDRACASTP